MPESPKTKSLTLPPPVRGWNTKDPISQMDPLYAVEMENYFPNNGTVDIRNGSRIFSSTPGFFTHNMASAFDYTTAAGVRWIVGQAAGVGSTRPYSVDSSGAVSDISGGGAVTMSGIYASAVNFQGRIFMKSQDSGTDVVVWTGTGNAAYAAFTGPSGDDKALRWVTAYKNRLYFAGVDLSVWYGSPNAVTGALTQFDFSSVMPHGGRILYIGPLSPDINNQRQNNFCVISSEGDVAIYAGDYPGDANWQIIGQYYIGPPAGINSFIAFQNDVLVVTDSGLVSVLAVANGSALENAYLTDNIQSVYKDYIATARTVSGTDSISGLYYPGGNMILVSITQTTTPSYSFVTLVFNTINKAWALWTTIAPFFWCNYDNKLMFTAGTTPRIMRGDFGDYDENPASPAAILTRTTTLRFAFNYLGETEVVKQPTQMVPILYESEGLSLTGNCDVDYSDDTATSTETNTTDTAYKLYKPQMGLKAYPGKAISVRFDGSVTTKRRSIQAVEVFWKDGDIR